MASSESDSDSNDDSRKESSDGDGDDSCKESSDDNGGDSPRDISGDKSEESEPDAKDQFLLPSFRHQVGQKKCPAPNTWSSHWQGRKGKADQQVLVLPGGFQGFQRSER